MIDTEKMANRTRASGLVYVLGALCAGALVAAFLVVGPASQSSATQSRIIKAQQGVVQSTVSGSGTIEPATQVGVDFANSGSLKAIYVTEGEHVTSGQLLAEVDPTSAESSLKSAEINLTDAEVKYEAARKGLTPEELHQTELGATQAHTSVSTAQRSERQAEQTRRSDEAGSRNSVAQAELALRRTEQSAALDATSQQDAVNQAISQRTADQRALAEARAQPNEATIRTDEAKVTQDENAIVNAQNSQASGGLKDQQSLDNARNAVTNARQSQSATRLRDEQSIAQARGNVTSAEQALQSTLAANAVKAAPPTHATVVGAATSVQTAKLSVQSARRTLSETKLYAPTSGVVAAINSKVGQSVSGNGGSSGAAGSSGTASSEGGSGASGASASSSGTATGTSTGASANSSASSSSSSKSFIELTDLHGFEMVVPLSESEVVHVHVGQLATVTVEALEGRKFAAHVVRVAVLATSNSGVVSYNVTFQLEQTESTIKPGMSASAEVVVNQAEGVNVPTSAISGGSVTVVRAGEQVRRRVVTGLAGNSSTIILSGLKAGEEVALPITSSAGSTSLLSKLAGGARGGGLGGGIGGGLGGGGFPPIRGGG